MVMELLPEGLIQFIGNNKCERRNNDPKLAAIQYPFHQIGASHFAHLRA